MSLTEFLLARIAEDEDCARYALTRGDGGQVDFSGQWFGAVAHAERWGPGRVLEECEAKRRIVERMGPFADLDHDVALWTISTLATPYAAHPDYDDSWRP